MPRRQAASAQWIKELVAASEYAVHDGDLLDGHPEPVALEQQPDAPGNVDALDMRKAYERANRLAAQTKGKVFKATITPHWFMEGTRFWYRNDLAAGKKEFLVVDAHKGERLPAFDHQKLAEALSKQSGTTYSGERLPFDKIDFTDLARVVRFRAGGADWECDLASYECSKTAEPAPPEAPADAATPQEAAEEDNDTPWAQAYADDDPTQDGAPQDGAPQQKNKGGKGKFLPPSAREVKSPDGKWTALIKEYNVLLRATGGEETPLTDQGTAGNPFASLTWSPDSKTLVAFRTEPGDNKEVYMIETSPKDQLPAKLHTRPYPRPGDKFALHEMFVIDLETRKPARVDIERIDFRGIPRLRWRKDGSHFTFEKTDRGHQRFRVVEVEARTGKTRAIIDDRANTFVDHYSFNRLDYLDDTDEILYVSEMDGWKHIYLFDARAGTVKQQITKGEYVVRGIDRVDVKNRQVWFHASGKNADQDPYFIHYYRVDFNGTGLVALTEGDGDHFQRDGLQFSPDKKFLIDTYSRVDMAAGSYATPRRRWDAGLQPRPGRHYRPVHVRLALRPKSSPPRAAMARPTSGASFSGRKPMIPARNTLSSSIFTPDRTAPSRPKPSRLIGR